MPNTINRIEDFTITEFEKIEAYNRGTGYLEFLLSELQDMTVNSAETTTDLTGLNGRVIGRKKSGKALTGTGTNGVISAGLMLAQTGGEILVDTHKVKKSEVKVVGTTGTVATDETAVGTAGDEIGEIKVLAKNGSIVNTYAQAAAADATHFAYDPTTKEITLPVSAGEQVIAEGAQIRYAYTRNVDGTKITDPSDKFSKTVDLWVHCVGHDGCDNEYCAVLHIPRCDFTGEFSLALGGDQTVQNFNFAALADTCGNLGSDLFELIIYTGDNE
jgi:hypothetical protein